MRAAGITAAEADRSGEAVRVLRRVDVVEGPTGLGDPDAGGVAVALDVETTGFDVCGDRIVELALRRRRYDPDGLITRVGHLYHWREDPGRTLPPEVARLTGLTDADLAGRAIDEQLAVDLIGDADLVLAHNARFDRPFVEGRLDGLHHLMWGCSMSQVDWAGMGYDGAKLGYLLNQIGRFHTPHGAGADVDALVTLLMHRIDGHRTGLSHVLDAVVREAWRVSAVGAPIGVKDELKRRGYRWDPGVRTWWREIDEDARAEEATWLAERVYGERGRVLGQEPRWDRVDRYRRFA